jgi:hypothetical protein
VPEPAFTDTVQIGIVVRDLEATMRQYAIVEIFDDDRPEEQKQSAS